MNTIDLALKFIEHSKEGGGATFDCQPIPNSPDVLQVTMNEMEEIPVYVSITDTQILCIVYLWSEADVAPDKKVEMMETMLEMNIPVPLSAFAKVNGRYALFGALSVNASFEEIVHEVATLTENSVEAYTEMEVFFSES